MCITINSIFSVLGIGNFHRTAYIVTMRITTSASVAKVNRSIYKHALFYSAHVFIILSTNGTLLGIFVCFFKSLWPIENQKHKDLINETVKVKFHACVDVLLIKG